MKKKSLFILIILMILISGIAILVLRNYITERPKIIKELPKETKSEERVSFPPLQVQERMFTLRGEIVEVKGNEINLKIISLVPPEFKETKTEIKKIIVTEETKILKQSIKEEKIGGVTFFLPVFEPEPIQLRDLKIGDQISVTSKENFEGKEEIVASQIVVNEVK